MLLVRTKILIVSLTCLILLSPHASADEDHTSLSHSITNMNKQISSLNKRANLVDQNIESISEEIGEINDSITTFKESLENLQEDVKGITSTEDTELDIPAEIEQLKTDLTYIKEDTKKVTEDVDALNFRFSQGTFNGTIEYTKDRKGVFLKDNKQILLEPRNLRVTADTQNLYDYLVEFSFFIKNEDYDENIKKGKTDTNPPAKILVHIPAYLLNDIKNPIILSSGNPSPKKASIKVNIPFEDKVWKHIEKSQLELKQYTDQNTRGILEMTLKNAKDKDQLQIKLNYYAPLDLNPFILGIQQEPIVDLK